MRILQLTKFFKPSWESGGPGRVAYEISNKFDIIHIHEDSIVDDISEENGIIMRPKRLAKLLGEERLKRVTKMEQAYRLAILPLRGVKDD